MFNGEWKSECVREEQFRYFEIAAINVGVEHES